MSLNRVQLIGRLGSDPELKYTTSGVAVCNLSIATSETWKNKNTGDKEEKTEWHRVIVFGKLAEHCNQYLTKGRQVYLEGKIQTRTWEDKDGVKKYTTEINSTHIQFLGGSVPDTQGNQGKGGESHSSSPAYNPEVDTNQDFASDSIHF